MVEYKIIIKKRFSWFKTVLKVCANTDSLGDIEKLIQDKLEDKYFSIATKENKLYVTSTYDIETVEVLPQ